MTHSKHRSLTRIFLVAALALVGAPVAFGQTTLLSEDFETCGHGSRYTEVNSHSDGSSDYFVRTDGTAGNTTVNCVTTSTTGLSAFSGMSNSYYYVGEDIDDGSTKADSGYVFFDDIDISGYNNINIKGYFALVTNGSDNDQYIKVRADIDNSGNYTLIGAFRTIGGADAVNVSQDTDLDGAGDGTVLTSTFAQYTFALGGTGSTLDLQIIARTNTGSDEFAFDLIQVEGTVAATTWNGSTWSGGTPTTSDNAIIASSTSPGNFSCNDITINSGVTLTMSGGTTATIAGDLTNSGNGFSGTGTFSFTKSGTASISGNAISTEGVINVNSGTTLSTGGLLTLTASSASSYGQLTGDGSVTGNVTQQAYLDPTSSGSTGRYYALGAPFTNATLSDFNEGETMVSANDATGTAWEWDAANAEWDPAGGGNLASTATSGKGYSIYVGMNGTFGPFLRSGAGVVSVSGSVTTSDVGVSISYNDGQASGVNFVGGTGVSATEGWNMVANPYNCTYDWDLQTLPSDLSGAIYRYDGSNYSSYTQGAGSGSRYISPFQGFFVQLTSNTPGTLTFAENNRVTSTAGTLSKTSYQLDGIDLIVENAQHTVWDELYVGFEDNSTADFDLEWDAHKLLNNVGVPNMYIEMGNHSYSICRVGLSDGILSFPVTIDHAVDGESLEIGADLSELKSFAKVELVDLKTGNTFDLTNGGVYAFTHDAGFNNNRFLVNFSSSTIGIDTHSAAESYVYSDRDDICIVDMSNEMYSVRVIDVTGRVIETLDNVEGNRRIHVPASGRIYFVQILNGDDVTTNKLIH